MSRKKHIEELFGALLEELANEEEEECAHGTVAILEDADGSLEAKCCYCGAVGRLDVKWED